MKKNETYLNGRAIPANQVECPHCVGRYFLGPVVAVSRPAGLLAMSRRTGESICDNCSTAEALGDAIVGMTDLAARALVESAALGLAIMGSDDPPSAIVLRRITSQFF